MPMAPNGEGTPDARIDAHDLGPALEPALHQATSGRLSRVRWFRTDWQVGGAATAYASCDCAGEPRDVVIKIPVGPREHEVYTLLAPMADAPTPRLAAEGREIGGYDFAWLVMERLPGDPLSAVLHADVFEHLAEAAASFYASMQRARELALAPERHNWESMLERSREALRMNQGVPHAQQWAVAVKHAQKSLPRLLSIWGARSINTWCHGDLHPGNCMHRPASSSWGPECYVLLDFAEVHPGHWVEDAVYVERQFWGRPQTFAGLKPVSLLAKARRDRGLDTSDDYGKLANVRRLLMAATTPAFLGREGHPAYLNAALETLERVMSQLKV